MAKKKIKTECSGMAWEDFLSLIERLKNDKKYKFLLFISVGVYCGLRASDILKLRWVDIISKTELVIEEKKTGKTRKIAFNGTLQEIIRLCYQNFHSNMRNADLSYIFSNKSGLPFTIQYVNRQLHLIFQKYNVSTLNGSSHTLRKTFGMHVYELNNKSEASLVLLSQIFQHSTISCTRRYIGIIQEQIQNVYLSL